MGAVYNTCQVLAADDTMASDETRQAPKTFEKSGGSEAIRLHANRIIDHQAYCVALR